MNPVYTIKEKILILKVRSGDEAAFANLYDQYIDKIYRFVYFKIKNEADTEDIVSKIFMKVWQYIVSGKEIDNLNAFIYRIAHNLVIDLYRSRQRTTESELSIEGEQLENVLPDKKQDPAALSDMSLQMEKVKSGLDGLKDQYREVIILKYVEDLSITEVAQIINKTNGATRVLLSRAMEALREILDEAQK